MLCSENKYTVRVYFDVGDIIIISTISKLLIEIFLEYWHWIGNFPSNVRSRVLRGICCHQFGWWASFSISCRPPRKLREGNVFTHVCLFTKERGYPWCMDPPNPKPPTSEIWWPSLETCSNFFTWGPLPVLTSGGRSTHGWQAGGTHPTGMLSCFCCTYTGITQSSSVHVSISSGFDWNFSQWSSFTCSSVLVSRHPYCTLLWPDCKAGLLKLPINC